KLIKRQSFCRIMHNGPWNAGDPGVSRIVYKSPFGAKTVAGIRLIGIVPFGNRLGPASVDDKDSVISSSSPWPDLNRVCIASVFRKHGGDRAYQPAVTHRASRCARMSFQCAMLSKPLIIFLW